MESGPKEFCSLESFLSPAFSDVPTTSRLGRGAELRADTLWNNVVAGRQSVVSSRLFDRVRPHVAEPLRKYPRKICTKYGPLEQHRRKSENNLHLDSPGLNDRSTLVWFG